MNEIWLAFVAFCGAGANHAVSPLGPAGFGVLAALFVAGAAGSVLHCGPMCGPFVLGQVADRMASIPAARLCESRRLAAGLLPAYHAGRLSTYAAIGAALGVLGGAPVGAMPLTGVLLLAAAVLFLAQAVKPWFPAAAARLNAMNRVPWARGIMRLAARLPRGRRANGFLVGVTLGFLPCGLLYGAAAIAAASGSWTWGAADMLAFGAGTVPALVVVGVAGQAAGRALQSGLALVTPAVLALNAVVLAVLAWNSLAG